MCAGLTRTVVAVADYVHEQQSREEGCEEHSADSCANHSRIHVVARLRCNTSQLHIAKQYASDKMHSLVFPSRFIPIKWFSTHVCVIHVTQNVGKL